MRFSLTPTTFPEEPRTQQLHQTAIKHPWSQVCCVQCLSQTSPSLEAKPGHIQGPTRPEPRRWSHLGFLCPRVTPSGNPSPRDLKNCLFPLSTPSCLVLSHKVPFQAFRCLFQLPQQIQQYSSKTGTRVIIHLVECLPRPGGAHLQAQHLQEKQEEQEIKVILDYTAILRSA